MELVKARSLLLSWQQGIVNLLLYSYPENSYCNSDFSLSRFWIMLAH